MKKLALLSLTVLLLLALLPLAPRADAITTDIAPNVEQLDIGTSSGFGNLLADDGSNWVGTEAAATSTNQYTPSSQTVAKGALTSGTYATCIPTSDDSRCTWTEGNQMTTTNLTPDSETLTKANSVSGVLSDENTDNGVSRVLSEANQGITGTIAFDAHAEFERTLTTDPQVWTHTPVGTPKAAIVLISHGTESTDLVVSVKWGTDGSCVGGTTMTRVTTATDTATEPGRTYAYFLGTGLGTGAKTVCADFSSATTTDIHLVSMTFTGSSDTEVVTSDVDQENQANPTATLAFGSRRSISAMIFYSGDLNPPPTTACSGSSACTLSHQMDQGAFGDSAAYQTTAGTTNEVMGWTQATDDVAVVYVAISEIATALDYELEYRVNWVTETCADSRVLTVNSWRSNANMENVNIDVEDGSDTGTFVNRLTVTATTDGTTQTYTLSVGEWDSGDVTIRFIDTTQSGDTLQGQFSMDRVVIECTPAADYELQVKHSWTGMSTTGISWTAYVEGREGAANPEQIDFKYYGSDEVTLSNIKCSITSTTESEQNCGALSADELDGGTPDVQMVDSNQAESAQSTVDLDRMRIERSFNYYRLEEYHKWQTTVTLADTYQLRVRALRSDTENCLVAVYDWTGASWTTRITVNSGIETLYTYSLAATERAANGSVMSRWVGSSETNADETQSTCTADQEIVQRTNNIPSLSLGDVTPDTGDTSQVFTFTVTYTDTLNCPASYVRVIIDLGAPVAMSEVNPGDTDCSDGKAYTTDQGPFTEATHSYSFTASDGENTEVTFASQNFVVSAPVVGTPGGEPRVGFYYLSTTTCDFNWFRMTATCTANETVAVQWYGKFVSRWWIVNSVRYNVTEPRITFPVGEGAGRQFKPAYYHFDVQYIVTVEGGTEVRYKPFDLTINLTWLWGLYAAFLAVLGLVILSRLRTRKHSEPPRKKVKR